MQNKEQKRVLSVQAIASNHVALLASICRAASLPDAGAKFTPRVYLHVAKEELRPAGLCRDLVFPTSERISSHRHADGKFCQVAATNDLSTNKQTRN